SCAGPDSVRWHRQEEGFLYVASKYVHLYALLCQAGLSGRPNSMLACKTVTEASSCLARARVGLNQYRVWGAPSGPQRAQSDEGWEEGGTARQGRQRRRGRGQWKG